MTTDTQTRTAERAAAYSRLRDAYDGTGADALDGLHPDLSAAIEAALEALWETAT